MQEFYRILFGEPDNASLLFALEIAFRTLVMYLYTIFLARMVGQGGVGQLGPFEFVLVIAIGSAAGDPMFYPDIGLLQGILVITVIIIAHRGTGWLLSRSRRLEKAVEGEPLKVVENGAIRDEALHYATITRSELMMLLRLEGIENTGEVRVAFFEPVGKLSVFRRDKAEDDGEPTLPHLARDHRLAR